MLPDAQITRLRASDRLTDLDPVTAPNSGYRARFGHYRHYSG